ncbi:MAG: SDR family oxidoreductase [Bacteroidota bacterium]
MTLPDLSRCIAIVAGASRGVGRGIALALGEAGATVYVTGRTLKAHRRRDAPGSIEETASEVTRLGGRGVAVQVDHTRVEDVRALVDLVRAEAGRLDLLVNAVWGGNEVGVEAGPLWEQPLAHWDAMMRAGVWAALLTSRYAVPLMTERPGGLVATVTFDDRARYTGHLYYDLAKAALRRFAFGLAEDLEPHGAASVAISPGFVRTERVLAAFKTSERRWRSVPDLAGTESPRYVGRVLAALAADPEAARLSGQTLLAADLAQEYGVTDLDGTQPEAFRLPA